MRSYLSIESITEIFLFSKYGGISLIPLPLSAFSYLFYKKSVVFLELNRYLVFRQKKQMSSIMKLHI